MMATNHPLRYLRLAIWQSLATNALDTAKAAAYSGMLMLFPAFLVLTTLLAVIPQGNSLLGELKSASEQFLPSDTMSLLQSYFQERKGFSVQVLLSAIGLTLFAAWGVMATLMAGFRRAYRLPMRGSRRSARGRDWGPWERRARALLLVPITLIPLSLASAIIIFGRSIERWMIDTGGHDLRPIVLFLWRMARWALALVTGTAVLGTVYHFGTNSREHWRCVLPGAITATLLWFPLTLAFGLYVTRMANYSVIYGSLGTAIATLVWLYLTAYSVLLGAHLNGTLYRERVRNVILQRNLHQSASANQMDSVDQIDPVDQVYKDQIYNDQVYKDQDNKTDPVYKVDQAYEIGQTPSPNSGSEANQAIPGRTAPHSPATVEEILLLDSPEMPREASQH